MGSILRVSQIDPSSPDTSVTITGTTVLDATSTVGGKLIGYRDIPRRTSGWAAGEVLSVTTGQTINTSDMAAGRALSFLNRSGSAWTLTAGSGVTLYFNGASVPTISVGARGSGTILCDSGTEGYVSGSNLS